MRRERVEGDLAWLERRKSGRRRIDTYDSSRTAASSFLPLSSPARSLLQQSPSFLFRSPSSTLTSILFISFPCIFLSLSLSLSLLRSFLISFCFSLPPSVRSILRIIPGCGVECGRPSYASSSASNRWAPLALSFTGPSHTLLRAR